MVASRLIKREKGSLPVDVRRSKTSLHVFFLFLELFRSLPSEELERLVLNGIAENSSMTDNDINLLSNQEDFDLESLIGR